MIKTIENIEEIMTDIKNNYDGYLMLYNIKVLQNSNNILFIFFDKDGNKITYKIKMNNIPISIFINLNAPFLPDNPYYIDQSKETLREYKFSDINTYKYLIYKLNDNFKKFMNQYKEWVN